MKKQNPFDHKTVEKVLFSTYKNGMLCGHRTRKYLRRMARYISHAWEIGRRDALAGDPMIPLEILQKPDDSLMLRDMQCRAYVAYISGYKSGNRERSGMS